MLCSFPTDSGTNFIKCTPLGGVPGSVYATPEGTPVDADHCVPGCSPARCGIDPPWTTCGYDTCQECAYHGGEWLRQMMVAHDQLRSRGMQPEWGYNEVVIDASNAAPLLPAMVEAYFVQACDA